MKRKKLFIIGLLAVASISFLAVSDIFAARPSTSCSTRFDDYCAIGAETCYFWSGESDEICMFDFSCYIYQ